MIGNSLNFIIFCRIFLALLHLCSSVLSGLIPEIFLKLLRLLSRPKGNQSWIFIVRTDAEAETPILWPPDVKNWLLGKDSDAGKDWRQEEKGMTEDG